MTTAPIPFSPSAGNAADPVELVLSHVANVRQNGTGWNGSCPACGDTDHHLHIANGDDGRVLMNCKHGCDFRQIVAALGLTEADLFPRRTTSIVNADPVENLARLRGWKPEAIIAMGGEISGSCVKWPMFDRDGKVTGHKVRHGDGTPFANSKKTLTVKGEHSGLHVPKQWHGNGPLLIVEGIADACAALSHGWTNDVLATDGANITKAARLAIQPRVHSRDIIASPDPDDEGIKKWLPDLAQLCRNAGCASFRYIMPDVKTGDLDKRLRAGEKFEDLISAVIPWTTPAQASGNRAVTGDCESRRLTDLGNAERFRDQHKDKVLYDAGAGFWRVWDETRWARDDDGAVARMAHETARSIYQEARDAQSREQAGALASWATRSESRERLRAMVDVGASLEGLVASATRFDIDPFLLNTPSGTVDLRTGTLRAHRREDYITRRTAAPFDPVARHEVLDRVLRDAMPDIETRDYFQRSLGNTACGDCGEEVIFFAYGPTAGGKSTMMESYKTHLGDYAAVVDPESLMRKQGDAGVRTDLARLAGVRLALTSEVEDGKHLAAGLIKRMSGGDTITARHLYRPEFEYRPQFTIWILANHRPRADAMDDALWRRVRVIPFPNSIPEGRCDPGIKRAMMTECGPALLAFAVAGCVSWLHDGLRESSTVRQAIVEYRESQDPLKDFLDDECAFGPDLRVSAKSIREHYEQWAKENGIRFPLSPRGMAERLRQRAAKDYKLHGERYWMGVGLSGLGALGALGASTSLTFFHEEELREVKESDAPSAPDAPDYDFDPERAAIQAIENEEEASYHGVTL
ncbi:MAG: phage/plasmid primase, P4 family [Candidatus Sumerlaeota bacterium]|nr:phage/plasmid primase, P4 family [Candidatus Sumerlaeota bacterium]